MAQQMTAVQEVSNTLMSMKPEFTEMLVKTGIDPDKFTRVAIMAVQNEPKLMQCSKPSLYKAFSVCARWGLLPDGNEAAIVPFGTEAVAMDMIQGILKQVRNSGELGCIDAQVVYEKDDYDSWTDEKGSHFKHKKARTIDRGAIILTYAYALTKDGSLYFEEVDEEQMKAIENVSRTKTVWNGGFKNEMRRKSALRRLAKRLPMSTDLEMVISRHDESFDLDQKEVEEKKEESTKSTRLSDVVDAQVTRPAPEPAPTPVKTAEPPDAAWRETEPKTDHIPLAAHEPPQGQKTVRGVISELKSKSGVTNGKPWSRYGCVIGHSSYGTFDSKAYDAMVNAKNNNRLIDLDYVETVKENKIYFECKSIHEVYAESSQGVAQGQDSGEIPF